MVGIDIALVEHYNSSSPLGILVELTQTSLDLQG